jgi:hypothetical protein
MHKARLVNVSAEFQQRYGVGDGIEVRVVSIPIMPGLGDIIFQNGKGEEISLLTDDLYLHGSRLEYHE